MGVGGGGGKQAFAGNGTIKNKKLPETWSRQLNWLQSRHDSFIRQCDNHSANDPRFAVLVSCSDELAVHYILSIARSQVVKREGGLF